MTLLASVVYSAETDDQTALNRAEAWERAALNRELAGITQLKAADESASEAMTLRNRAYLGTEERLTLLARSGRMEAEAGALCAAAFKNFTQASANWDKAASEYGKGEKVDKQMAAQIMREDARNTAFEACVRAAEAYERAAGAYDEHGSVPAQVAQHCEQAAAWREKIAQMQ